MLSLYTYFLYLFLYLTSVLANEDETEPLLKNSNASSSSSGLSIDHNYGHPPITHIQKGIRVGQKGSKVLVPLPTRPLKVEGGKYPKGYYRKEERIARKANTMVKKGQYIKKEEAIVAAKEYVEQKSKIDEQKRTNRTNRNKPPLPKGYHSKTSWTFRRMAGILQADNNQINDLAKAKKMADQLWEEKLQKNRDLKRESRQRKKMEKQTSSSLS